MKQFIRRALAQAISKLPTGILTADEHYEIYQSAGFHVTPVHYYSPILNTADVNPSIWDKPSELSGIDKNIDEQLRFLSEFSSLGYLDEYHRLPADSAERDRYNRNGGFGREDGAVLYSMIRKLRPGRIIEIGAGQSTLLSAIALQANGRTDARHIAIDPYPQPYLQNQTAPTFELVAKKVEDVPFSVFEELSANDILFIDSSHSIRIGGDVLFEILDLLPRLKPGVFIHIHDIFLPHHYDKGWILKRHVNWTEQYLVQAFLAFNKSFKIVWCYGIMQTECPHELASRFPRQPAFGNGSSLWLRRDG